MSLARIAISCLLVSLVVVSTAWARRDALTGQQKEQLQKIDRILLDVLALTDQGQTDASPFRDLTAKRFGELGYTIVTDPSQPYDVLFRVKCEQRKVWEGTMASGGDADLPDSPMRTWKGPACQLTYLLDGKSTQWKKEVRTAFADAIAAAAQAKASDAGPYALDHLKQRLEEYDFPVFVTADWGQDSRLLKVLAEGNPPTARRVRIIQSLGEIFSTQAVPQLQAALKDPNPDVSKAAAIALGNIGHKDSIASLISMLKTGSPDQKVVAAKALGKVGALHGDASIIPPLLEALNTDDLVLKTEVVWALGQLPDRRAYEPLVALQRSLRNVRTDRGSQEGKLWEAVNYSIKQLDGFDQIN
ncbi:MAG TPA: HEAT repeat domain-containing protein [Nitrospira sp.]|nr:HEAT repeat domain-containing protein [Nitrospira sp.]